MKILDKFFKIRKNEEENENQNKDNLEIKESIINTLQKQVLQKTNSTAVETAIRSGDGLGMNTKIGG